MNKRRLGHSSVEVTEVGFGGAQIGNLSFPTGDEDAVAAVDAAWEAGVRYFDTAPHYGLGLSERRLGKALAGRSREEVVISTKVGRLLVPNPVPSGSDLATGGFAVPDDLTRVYDYSRDGVLRSLEGSLERLGMDRIDVVYVHDPDDYLDQAVRETVPALVELRDEGVVGAVGAGMNFWEPLLRIVQETDADAVMLAGRWTLLDRSGEPLVAECEERGVSVVAASPFNTGLLAQTWPPDGATFNYRPASVAVLERARALAQHCREHGATLPVAAMRFPLRHPAVASVVAGMRTAEQAASAVRWAATEIGDEAWPALDAVVAGWVPA
jgi:D-threo-aldose 1-dehydrogenase